MKKILFIEDEQALQKNLKKALANEGFPLISAFNGEEGLNLAKKEKPDLILLDLILPKLDGFGVLKKLKEDPETEKIPILILTNLEDPYDIQKALELGANKYLVKANYELEDVIKKIKEML